jgi:hypothetical protein
MSNQYDEIFSAFGVKPKMLTSNDCTTYSSNPLQQYLHSSNNLGDIYHIPYGVLNIDYDSLYTNFLGSEVRKLKNHIEIVVIHRDALKHQLS